MWLNSISIDLLVYALTSKKIKKRNILEIHSSCSLPCGVVLEECDKNLQRSGHGSPHIVSCCDYFRIATRKRHFCNYKNIYQRISRKNILKNSVSMF